MLHQGPTVSITLTRFFLENKFYHRKECLKVHFKHRMKTWDLLKTAGILLLTSTEIDPHPSVASVKCSFVH